MTLCIMTLHNDTMHYDTKHDTQQNDIMQNDTKQNSLIVKLKTNVTQRNNTQHPMLLCWASIS